ncbi:MAG: hypothetical protein K1X29_02750 [Bdellovibrionales bacterium]|nr:hypothetical protein [Bdellovibrionales bacterium]
MRKIAMVSVLIAGTLFIESNVVFAQAVAVRSLMTTPQILEAVAGLAKSANPEVSGSAKNILRAIKGEELDAARREGLVRKILELQSRAGATTGGGTGFSGGGRERFSASPSNGSAVPSGGATVSGGAGGSEGDFRPSNWKPPGKALGGNGRGLEQPRGTTTDVGGSSISPGADNVVSLSDRRNRNIGGIPALSPVEDAGTAAFARAIAPAREKAKVARACGNVRSFPAGSPIVGVRPGCGGLGDTPDQIEQSVEGLHHLATRALFFKDGSAGDGKQALVKAFQELEPVNPAVRELGPANAADYVCNNCAICNFR